MNATVHQTEHDLLRDVLRIFLVDEVASSRRTGGCDRVGYGAVAALDALLAAHPVDRRGRCRSCRGPGWLGRRSRMYMVFRKTHYWLRQPTDRMQNHPADEFGMNFAPLPEAADQPRCGPSVDPSPGPGQSPLLTGGISW